MYPLRLLLVCLLFLGACSAKPIHTESDILAKGKELEALTEARTVHIVDAPYLGAVTVPLTKTEKALTRHIALNMKGTLADICAAASHITNMPWYVEDETSCEHPIRYSGNVNAFCQYLAMRYGYVWQYNAETESILFSRVATRTFTLLAAPGSVFHESKITNESSGGSTEGAESEGGLDTAQSNATSVTVDVWSEALSTIKSLLSKEGSVTANMAAGTVTVSDNARTIRQVEGFINDYNKKLCRQVALQVRVWQLTIDNENEVGLNLKAMFNDGGKLSLSTGTPLDWASLGGELNATITGGKLKDSQATLKALSTYGKTTLVTSGSGVTMNNQPLPVQNTTRDTYLASMSLNTTDYGQTSEIKPGEVTTGFAMTVIPHILDRRTLILQYNASLNSLDAIRDFTDGSVKVELPKVSTRAFSQRVTMRMGQTLVLAGFEQELQGQNDALGALQIGRAGNYGRTLIIITISVESVPGYEGAYEEAYNG